MEKKTIGSFIAALRKSNGMTQQDLAERINVSNKTVSKWECDDGYPDLALIPVIAEIFNVTSDEILKGGRINKESITPEKEQIKVDQQIKRLINNTLSKFKIWSCVSGLWSVLALINLFVLAYGAYLPYVAIGLCITFAFTSIAIIGIQYTVAKSAIKNADILDEFDSRILAVESSINQGFLGLIMLNFSIIIISIPFSLSEPNWVITFESYLRILPQYIFLLLIPVLIITYISYMLLTQKKIKAKIESNIRIKKNLRKLNLIILIIPCSLTIASIILIFFQYRLLSRNIDESAHNDISFAPSLIVIALLFYILSIIYIIVRKKILKDLLP